MALQKSIVRHYLQLKAVSDISEELVLAVVEILPATAAVSRVNLPGNRYACRRERRLVIE